MSRNHGVMAGIPDSTKVSLTQRLNTHAQERWPQISRVNTRFHGSFAYVSARLADGDDVPLMRLRYAGSARCWGFAIYRASHNDYEDSLLPDGKPSGTPGLTLNTAAALYLTRPNT